MSNLSPNDSTPKPLPLSHVSLVLRQQELIRDLPGFKKQTHRVPDEINANTRTFVAKLGTKFIQSDLDQVFRELRAAFRFKRTEIQSTEWQDGSGTVVTPYFRYGTEVRQDDSQAAKAILQRDISDISAAERLLSDSFAQVFGSVFDTVEFAPPQPIDLEQIIDRIEGLEDERILLAYDRQITCCDISWAGMGAKIQVTANAFRIVHPRPEPPRVLVESFFSAQNMLLDRPQSS